LLPTDNADPILSKRISYPVRKILAEEAIDYEVPSPPCDCDNADKIKHFFVLMLENRSFDHIFGFSAITGKDAVTGLPTQINGLHCKQMYPCRRIQ